MPRLQRKSFTTPDQVRTFQAGRVDIVTLDENAMGRFVFQPGWRWSKDVAPIVNTHSCQHRHLGYTLSGQLEVRMDDGTKLVIGPGDAYEIPPGHDAWVVGDVPWDSVEFASAHAYGLSPEQLGERVLATILFSDIVDSTAMLERLGLRLRVGIHTGEVELAGGQARGVAVDAAARVASLAGRREVLVCGTTRDLLDGSDLSFEPRGEHELKGLSGKRPIFVLLR